MRCKSCCQVSRKKRPNLAAFFDRRCWLHLISTPPKAAGVGHHVVVPDRDFVDAQPLAQRLSMEVHSAATVHVNVDVDVDVDFCNPVFDRVEQLQDLGKGEPRLVVGDRLGVWAVEQFIESATRQI